MKGWCTLLTFLFLLFLNYEGWLNKFFEWLDRE